MSLHRQVLRLPDLTQLIIFIVESSTFFHRSRRSCASKRAAVNDAGVYLLLQEQVLELFLKA